MSGQTKERPILFSAPMVRAILDGRKTQTRRIVKPQPIPHGTSSYGGTRSGWKWKPDTLNRGWNDDDADPYNTRPLAIASAAMSCECPYGQPEERLWVKETFSYDPTPREQLPASDKWRPYVLMHGLVMYRATDGWNGPWNPSIYMPRAASRITLEIVNVRADRLQEISEEDALAEGVVCRRYCERPFLTGALNARFSGETQTATSAYRELWETINGPGSWHANPWVWVITFKRAE